MEIATKYHLNGFKIGENVIMIEQYKIKTIVPISACIVCCTCTNDEQFSNDNGRKEQIPTILRQSFFTRYLPDDNIIS